MRKVLGMFGLLVILVVVVAAIEPLMTDSPAFKSAQNIQNVATWTGLFGILAVGEAFVIITGGIDLSVGSVVGLVGVVSASMMHGAGAEVSPAVVIPLCLALSLVLGLIHGLLITKARMQPFVVTLCGLLIYRGIARFIAGDMTCGFGIGFQSLKFFAKGMIPGIGVPMPLALLFGVAAVAAVLLHYSVFGRHLFALGRNKEAARFSGIRTDRAEIAAYMICSLMAGLAGLLFALNVNSLQPSNFGNFYELYAIAGAVLGGCSLRGGEGTIVGVVIGTIILRLLPNIVNMLDISSELEYAVVGGVILIGVLADELMKARAEKRLAKRKAKTH
ncbi:MAG TPA: ABC transporter permease [Candidatus Brocadiia bacterium]|nr:ABC transporter permease [Candidatus Brocadiia bacterium]